MCLHFVSQINISPPLGALHLLYLPLRTKTKRAKNVKELLQILDIQQTSSEYMQLFPLGIIVNVYNPLAICAIFTHMSELHIHYLSGSKKSFPRSLYAAMNSDAETTFVTSMQLRFIFCSITCSGNTKMVDLWSFSIFQYLIRFSRNLGFCNMQISTIRRHLPTQTIK